MCTFIFAVLPSGFDAKCLQGTAEAFGIYIRPSQESFPPVEDTIWYASTSHCDCGTALGQGSLKNYVFRDGKDLDEEVKKLRKKGWSEIKIARWKLEKEQANEKHRESGRVELQRWLDFLPAALKVPDLAWFGVFYHSNWDDRKAAMARTVRVPVSSLDDAFLLHMEEDMLYQFISRQK